MMKAVIPFVFVVAGSAAAQTQVGLETLRPSSHTADYGYELMVNKTNGGRALTMSGTVYLKGLSTVASSDSRWSLNQEFSRLEATVGHDDSDSGGDGFVVTVSADFRGNETWQDLWVSKTHKKGTPPESFGVSLQGAYNLRISSQKLADSSGDWIDIASPVLTREAPSYWLPVAVHAGGIGAQWRTDVGILNAGASAASIEIRAHAASGLKTTSRKINPGEQAVYTDALSTLFGLEGSAPIEILSDQMLRITNKVYNESDTGTYGSTYETLTNEQGLMEGQIVYLPHLREDTAFRTNIGFTNAGTTNASIAVTLYDNSGKSLASYTVDLQPGEFKQDVQPFRNRGHQTSLLKGYAKVQVKVGASILGYASVIDNATGDPVSIGFQR